VEHNSLQIQTDMHLYRYTYGFSLFHYIQYYLEYGCLTDCTLLLVPKSGTESEQGILYEDEKEEKKDSFWPNPCLRFNEHYISHGGAGKLGWMDGWKEGRKDKRK
jgi:hypothetical protein